jgi:hypothetical protein
VPIEDFGEIDTDSYEVHDLLTDTRYIWHGQTQLRRAPSRRATRAHPAGAAIVAGASTPADFDCKAPSQLRLRHDREREVEARGGPAGTEQASRGALSLLR